MLLHGPLVFFLLEPEKRRIKERGRGRNLEIPSPYESYPVLNLAPVLPPHHHHALRFLAYIVRFAHTSGGRDGPELKRTTLLLSCAALERHSLKGQNDAPPLLPYRSLPKVLLASTAFRFRRRTLHITFGLPASLLADRESIWGNAHRGAPPAAREFPGLWEWPPSSPFFRASGCPQEFRPAI